MPHEQQHLAHTAGGSEDATVLEQDDGMPADANEGVVLYSRTLGHTADSTVSE